MTGFGPERLKALNQDVGHKVNQKGSIYYQEQKYDDAIAAFEKAAELDKEEPKYPSNLSAVLYEVGKYADAIHAVAIAWSRLQARDGTESPTLNDPLAVKLVTRFAKAKANLTSASLGSVALKASDLKDETAHGEIEDKVQEEMEAFVSALGSPNLGDTKVAEMMKAWGHWKAIRDSLNRDREQGLLERQIAEAEKRFRSLPIFKSAPDPTLQSFTFSTDECRSLLDPMGEMTFDRKLTSNNPKKSKPVSWSFLFGGSGDARHAFTTLSHVAAEMKRGVKVEKLHLTMVDIHVATQARFIIMLALLQQVLDNPADDPDSDSDEAKEREIEIYSAIFFVYTSVVIPGTCCDLVIETADALVKQLPLKTHPISKYVHFDEQSLAAVLDALAYWSKPLPKSTKRVLEIMRSLPPSAVAMEDDRANAANIKAMIGARKKPATMFDSTDAEQMFFLRAKVLLPPGSHISRYPALEAQAKGWHAAGGHPSVDLDKELERLWKPNPTLFDQTFTEWEVPFLGQHKYKGYPYTMSNFYHKNFHKSLQTTTINIAGQPSPYCGYSNGFEITTQFFTMVANALARLSGVLTIEVIAGDVMTGIAKAVAGDLGPRPESFPKTFTRMWLSNVPDYTHGLLSTAVYLVPYLEDRQIAVANNLSYFGWRSMDEYCHNYTLLKCSDMPRFLGCLVVNPHRNVMYEDISLEKLPLPRPIGTLASKKELHDWLSRILLCVLCHGTSQAPPFRIDMPSNINAFFHVLAHLVRVGFPPHWVGDFVQSIVSDSLVTGAVPYVGNLPIPLDFNNKKKPAPRKVQLQTWQADIEAIVASTRLALPFFIALPETYPTVDDIQVYKAEVRPVDLTTHRKYWMPRASLPSLMPPFSKIVGLIFYKPQRSIDGDAIADHIPDILEGSGKMKDVQVQILLGQEYVDIYRSNVSWKMTRRRYETMKAEGWEMVAYRTDVQCAITFPVKADKWGSISAP